MTRDGRAREVRQMPGPSFKRPRVPGVPAPPSGKVESYPLASSRDASMKARTSARRSFSLFDAGST